MKAIVCEQFGQVSDLVIKEIETPQLKDNEVLINVAAAGVNYPDGLLVQGLYQVKPEVPFVPGTEIAGTIVALGEKVAHLKVGMRVAAMTMLGGYAEQVAINCMQVMPIPDFLSFEEASALFTAHATAHHALKQRANLQAGETILITGAAGGTGLAAVQIAKAIGAKVIAAASSQEKLEVCKKNGADILINYSEQDLKTELKALTNGKGVDVVYETVGGDTFHACSRNMAWNGRLLVIGFAGGDIPKFPVNLALVKGCSVIGVFWGTFTQKQPKDFLSNMQELMDWYAQGKVKVVIDQLFPLHQAAGAINKILNRQVKGKVILTL
jgi:NADPH2:quinone reductase|tara:strand:- start:986 stop:1960 length:975 start_codon:yes stop_codon:yes gene_type:complete